MHCPNYPTVRLTARLTCLPARRNNCSPALPCPLCSLCPPLPPARAPHATAPHSQPPPRQVHEPILTRSGSAALAAEFEGCYAQLAAVGLPINLVVPYGDVEGPPPC